MAAVKTDLYIVLVNAGVPEETAGKLAVAHSKLDVEATLIAALEAIGKVRKWQQTVDEGCREMLAKDKPAIGDDRDRVDVDAIHDFRTQRMSSPSVRGSACSTSRP